MHPEDLSKSSKTALKKVNIFNKIPTGFANYLTTVLFYFSILLFLIAFNFAHNPPAGFWYQQFMPNIGNRQIKDITFLDSLTGYASANTPTDSSYILKTTDGGDSWQIIYRQLFYMTRLQFLNINTGYAGGAYIYKTINGGLNWTILDSGLGVSAIDISILNQDTMWFVDDNNPTGGVFRTTNGGVSWDTQFSGGTQNPNKIYMFNARIGFICKDNVYLRRTTDSGQNWSVISGMDGFVDMYFVDSLTGWKCSVFGMKKTINGGLNWITQTLPSGGIIQTNGISSFSNINRDTIWANGGYVLYPNNQIRSILNRTTNQGDTWYFQIPDTTQIDSIVYYHMNFTNKLNGWAYNILPTGIHTTTGGDTSFLLPIKQISREVPKDYNLYQNYPNPFNPSTIIRFKISKQSDIQIIVYDIQGRKIAEPVNSKLNAGEYETVFKPENLSSGIYFYSLIADGVLSDTKRMVYIK